jgi:hypothetical protein
MIIYRLRPTRPITWLISLFVFPAVVLNTAPLSADVWGHWPLNDGQGEIANDLGPRGYDGEIGNFDFGGLGPDGSVWFDDPERGTVISFAGDPDGAWVFAGFMPDLLTLDDDNDFTWSFWARQDEDQATPSNVIILGNRYNANGVDTVPREFVKFTPNRFEYHMNAGIGVTTNPDGTEEYNDDLQYLDCDYCPERHIPSDPSEWLHHTVVKDGDTLTYYRNGEPGNSRTIETDQLSGDPLPIFFGGYDAGEKWRGFMSDVRLFDHALTAEEVLALVGDGGDVIPGDFNRDGQLTAADIDDLTGQSAGGTHPADYDLNSDALVNGADVTFWVRDLYNSWIGDANLDGQFNSSDLVGVLAAGTYEVNVASTWSTGDFNGDGRTNSSDLVAALSDGGYEMGPRAAVAAVPEPCGCVLWLLGAGALVRAGRRKR